MRRQITPALIEELYDKMVKDLKYPHIVPINYTDVLISIPTYCDREILGEIRYGFAKHFSDELSPSFVVNVGNNRYIGANYHIINKTWFHWNSPSKDFYEEWYYPI